MHHRHIVVTVIVGLLFATNVYARGQKPTAVLTWSSTYLASWQLTYGDGANGSGPGVPPLAPSHVYAPATYTAQLTVVNGGGRSASASVNVTLAAPPPPPPPADDWTFCATEGGFCTFTGTQQVRYGANGSYFYQTLSGGTPCTNSVFGDPIYGVVKQCAIPAGASIDEWTFCAVENQTCAFTGTREMRYGANGSYFYKTLSDGTPCTNSVFGDPIYGVVKQCATPAGASIDEWTFCTVENQTCAFTGTREVRYGANGSYAYRLLSNGTPCTNGVFGDPIYGTAKQCHIKGPTITCPAGAVDIWPGQPIPLIVDSHAGSTTFCLRAGMHSLTSSIRPKTGNTFVGDTARSSTAPAGRRPTIRRPRSGRTTKTSTT